MPSGKQIFPFVIALVAACGQTPITVPQRSMERPKDFDLVCLHLLDDRTTWQGAPLSQCGVDGSGNPRFPPASTPPPADEYHLHAVVTQQSRGELAIVDLGRSPFDTASLVKVDPRAPGFTFLPVGAVPTDVVADPRGRAVFVASGYDSRVDIIPAEMLRGPVDTFASGRPYLWPHLDLGPNDGAPSRLVVSPDGNRLYVVFPEARPASKLAVFDISSSFLAPPRLPDVTLTLNDSVQPRVAAATCPTKTGKPWWIQQQEECGFAAPPPAPPPAPLPPPDRTHLAGVALAGDKMFAADDAAPILHVFDVSGPRGTEIARIAIGAPTSSLAVSEVLPDEATAANVRALDACEAHNWVGDGRDHRSDAPTPDVPAADIAAVTNALGGQCRAHRYVYAIDPNNLASGDGSIAVVDIPTTVLRDKDGRITAETLDLNAAKVVQPMACESPTFAPHRVPVGTFGISGGNRVPARAVTFVRYNPRAAVTVLKRKDGVPLDPPQTEVVELPSGVRCRERARYWADQSRSRPEDNSLDPKPFAITEKSPLADKREAAAIYWSGFVSSRPIRGTYAMAMLDNGSLMLIDVDDLDAACRGPSPTVDTSKEQSLTTGELTGRGVRRHQPRSKTLFFSDGVPSASTLNLLPAGSTAGTFVFDSKSVHLVDRKVTCDGPVSLVLPNKDTDTLEDIGKPYGLSASCMERINPGLRSDARPGTKTPVNVIALSTYVLPSADNPRAITAEEWLTTYQGRLPGFVAAAGSFEADKTDASKPATLLDPDGHFCRRGVEADADPSSPSLARNDIVQIVDEVCRVGEGCTQSEHDACVDVYGETSEPTLRPTRDLVIGQAFENRVTLPSPPKDLKRCFPGLTRYTVRASNAWVVTGSSSGYLHRRRPAAEADPTSACVVDASKPLIYNGRAYEVDSKLSAAQLEALRCRDFKNPSWTFLIQAGPSPSIRDTRFYFRTQNAFTPLSVGIGNSSLPVALRPISFVRGGEELLNWNQVGVVDAIERGLSIFSLIDLTNVKTVL